jgi:hypothetical protein
MKVMERVASSCALLLWKLFLWIAKRVARAGRVADLDFGSPDDPMTRSPNTDNAQAV